MTYQDLQNMINKVLQADSDNVIHSEVIAAFQYILVNQINQETIDYVVSSPYNYDGLFSLASRIIDAGLIVTN